MNVRLSALAFDRWQFPVVIFSLLAALGISATLTIPKTEDPQINPPTFVVTAVLPGATPSEVEELVTKPIENVIYKLDSLHEVRSQSRDGLSSTHVEFKWGTDPESTYDQVSREVNALRATLPPNLQRLEIVRGRPLTVAIAEVALASDILPMRRLEKLADRLRERLGSIPGIDEAKYWGATSSELRVSLDLARLAAQKVTPSDVIDALRAGGGEYPIGTLDGGGRRFNVRFAGAYPDAQTVADIPILAHNGSVLRVRDLAVVGWAEDQADHITRFNGHRALLLTVTQGKDQDITQLSGAIKAELDSFERSLPGGVTLFRGFDQADNVRHRLGELDRDFGLALALVLITLLPLGWRAASVVMIAIPLSLLIGIAVLARLGFTLNQLAISGLVVALGLLVDDAIVVIENISRWLREGYDRRSAAVGATAQITLAVVGCTACLMLSFVPLLALPEASGEFIRSLPVAVLATVGGSLLVALFVVPLAASRMLSPKEDHEGNLALRWVKGAIRRFYQPVLMRALARPRLSLALLLALTIVSFPLITTIGVSLFPPAETPEVLVRVEMPQGASLDATDSAVQFVEARLAHTPQVSWYAGNVGRGNPHIYYNVAQKETDPAFGEIAVGLRVWDPEKSPALLERLREEFGRHVGAKVSIVTFSNGPEIEAPVVIRLTGRNLDTLTDLARGAELALDQTPGLRDISNPLRQTRTDLRFNVDDAAVAAQGVRAGAVRESLQLALSGVTVANLRDADTDQYPVKVRLPMLGHNTVASLNSIFVPTSDGAAAPLSELARLTFSDGPARIDRLNRIRAVTLTAYVAPGVNTAKATQDAVRRIKARVPLPPGYALKLGGEADTASRSFAGFLPAVLVAALGILAILVLEFGKFRTVAVVFGIVPFGFLGAVVALWLAGYSLSFTAAIGLIALIGIETKNSILLVDFTEQSRRDGMSIRAAVERAGELRFFPVLLTSATAIGGLLPLALSRSGLFAPLAVTMIGGLIASTLLARIATPVMYLLLAAKDREVAPV
jgi:multidrug efflux pump subunit AcrB